MKNPLIKITKNIIIFYHKNCLDGFASSYVAWKKFKDTAEYIPLSHNETGKDILKGEKIKIADLKDKEVYFIDFCLGEEEIRKIEKNAKKLVIIDHHIGTKELVESLSGSVFKDGVSGAYLAHEYFFSKKDKNYNVPKLIKYISIGDTYTWGQEKFEQEILNYINIQEFDFKIFLKLEKDLEDKNKFNQIKEIGELFQKVKVRQINSQIENAKIINWEGYEVYALNSTTLSSEIGNKLCDENKIDFAMIYRFSDNELRFSLRGKDKVNLSELSKKCGGGGHFNASGFRTRDQKFIEDFIKKIIN